ncbi:acetylcholine receptor subunit beta-type unc-29-like [Ostrea edulis]|uniref:acetylcholine receptor subunit beta-type unc-29-like n=1 Tax=Ostrea edulis TaxID=37623 RepID=UPI0024AEC154|nr:acetylcholine receptor subunit beta-type unc-29-like [Ostrea edulis]
MKSSIISCWFPLLTLGLRVSTVHTVKHSDAEALLKDIFRNYSANLLPNLTEATEVSVYPLIFAINDFDEVSGVISVVCGISLSWQDFRLTWNPNNYGGITDFPITPKNIWIPNILLINPVNKMEAIGGDHFVGRVFHNGFVNWFPGCLIQTLCNVNMYRFPFDTQKCTFNLGIWGYSHLEVGLTPYQNISYIITTFYSPHAQWELERTGMERHHMGQNNNIIQMQLILKRKSLYFVINMLAPILLLSVLNPLVFVLPVDSGERVSYAITIFLSFAVFMTLLSDNIPKSSEPMSLMSYFLIETMGMSTLICVLTVITMNFHFKKSQSRVSRKAVIILNVLQLQFLCQLCEKETKESKIYDNAELGDISIQNITNEGKLQKEKAGEEISWKTLAEGYDSVMMYYFYFFVFLQWSIFSIIIAF